MRQSQSDKTVFALGRSPALSELPPLSPAAEATALPSPPSTSFAVKVICVRTGGTKSLFWVARIGHLFLRALQATINPAAGAEVMELSDTHSLNPGQVFLCSPVEVPAAAVFSGEVSLQQEENPSNVPAAISEHIRFFMANFYQILGL